METSHKKTAGAIKYSFRIYMPACLALAAAGAYLARSKSDPDVNYIYLVSASAFRFILVSLAWIAGKRYGLNYIGLCLLGGWD